MGGWVSGCVGRAARAARASSRQRRLLRAAARDARGASARNFMGQACESRARKARGRIVVLGEDGDDECWVWRRSLPVQYVATL